MSERVPSFPAFLEAEVEPIRRLSVSRLSETFLAYDRACGRKVIVKRALCGDGLLENEYRVCTQLAGEGMPVCYRLAKDGETVCLVREYVEGKTLLEALDKPLGEGEALRIVIDLCRILRRFHDHQPPYVHRDIKAENVVLRPDGRCSLIDTGTVRLYDEAASRDTQVLGTPVISPPEQYGYRQTDPRSDVYALGVLLHQLTTGTVDLNVRSPNRRITGIVERCTRFDPAHRYANATAVKAACERALEKRSRRLGAAALAGALLAVLALVAYPLATARLPQAAPEASPAPAAADELHVFASETIEKAVCAQLGKEPGTVTCRDLAGINTLLIYGDRAWGHIPQMSTTGAKLRLDGQLLETRGAIDTLEDLRCMTGLTTLALCGQQIADLSPLAGLNVMTLALHDNLIRDLSPLAECAYLQELFIGANPVEDFSPLARCQQLKSLYAGATNVRDASAFAQIPSLYVLELAECQSLGSLEALVGYDTLHYLKLLPVSREQLSQVGRMTSLRGLFLWNTEGLTDLTPLGDLTDLRVLFVDTLELTSLEGIERMTSLENLGLYRVPVADLSPLSSLPRLSALSFNGVSPRSWEPLTRLTALTQVECDAAQKQTLESLLPGVKVIVTE